MFMVCLMLTNENYFLNWKSILGGSNDFSVEPIRRCYFGDIVCRFSDSQLTVELIEILKVVFQTFVIDKITVFSYLHNNYCNM